MKRQAEPRYLRERYMTCAIHRGLGDGEIACLVRPLTAPRGDWYLPRKPKGSSTRARLSAVPVSMTIGSCQL